MVVVTRVKSWNLRFNNMNIFQVFFSYILIVNILLICDSKIVVMQVQNRHPKWDVETPRKFQKLKSLPSLILFKILSEYTYLY
jgi:hypothetical protein